MRNRKSDNFGIAPESMNSAEMAALEWILRKGVDIEDVERTEPKQSIDFVVNGVLGVEVKSKENYLVSKNQLEAINGLEECIILVAPNGDDISSIWVESIIQGVKFVKESYLTGQKVHEGINESSEKTRLGAKVEYEQWERFNMLKHKLGFDKNSELINFLCNQWES